jgi:hypothetical protein
LHETFGSESTEEVDRVIHVGGYTCRGFVRSSHCQLNTEPKGPPNAAAVSVGALIVTVSPSSTYRSAGTPVNDAPYDTGHAHVTCALPDDAVTSNVLADGHDATSVREPPPTGVTVVPVVRLHEYDTSLLSEATARASA